MSGLPAVSIVDDEVRLQETLRRTLDGEFDLLAAGIDRGSFCVISACRAPAGLRF